MNTRIGFSFKKKIFEMLLFICFPFLSKGFGCLRQQCLRQQNVGHCFVLGTGRFGLRAGVSKFALREPFGAIKSSVSTEHCPGVSGGVFQVAWF